MFRPNTQVPSIVAANPLKQIKKQLLVMYLYYQTQSLINVSIILSELNAETDIAGSLTATSPAVISSKKRHKQ